MKKLMLVLTAALALNAFATSPISIDPNVIMTLTVGGGMPVPGGLGFRKISVTRDGVVNVEEYRQPQSFEDKNDRGSHREYVLATYPAQDMLEIGQAIGAIKGGRLVKPNRPPCMDAPGYTYIVNKNGAAIAIYRQSNCIEEQLADPAQRPAALALKTFLDELNRMAN